MMDIALETLQNLPIAAWAYDTQDHFKHVVWNQAMADLTGLPTEKAIGLTNYDLFEKETADQMMKDNYAVIEGKVKYVIDREVITTGEGKQVAIRTTKVPLFDAQDNSTLLIGTCVPLNDA